MSNIIQLKRELVKACKNLKDINMYDKHRIEAYGKIVTISKEIIKLESKFEFDDKILINFKKYKPVDAKDVIPRVVWPELYDETFGTELEKHLEQLTALAVKITHKRLPREPQDSPLFGQIISATTGHLIALEKH